MEVGNVWDGKIEDESDSRKVAEAATDAVADYIFDVVNLSSPALIKPCLVRVPGGTHPLGRLTAPLGTLRACR